MINGRWWWWFTWSWRVVRRNQPPPSPSPPPSPPPADEDVLPFEEYPPPSSDEEEEEEINHPTPQTSNEAADRRHGLLPASRKAIQGLREVTAAGAGEDECAVCLQDFEAGDKLRMMPCCHTFHQRCIFDWLRLSCICPLCRHTLPTQNVEDDRLGRAAHTVAGSTG
uniref:RING-type domain-containing protein n=1 Tax=Oryza glumipatula TaxID=40148 RepID=A0A0E0BF90_9ORYZ